jgi:hypothetical protein
MFAVLRRWRFGALLLAALLLAPAGCNTSPTTTPSTKPAPSQDKDKGGPKPPNPDVG